MIDPPYYTRGNGDGASVTVTREVAMPLAMHIVLRANV